MKRIFTYLVFLLVFVLNVQAEPVSKEEAKKVANRVVELYNTSGARAVVDVTAHQLENGTTAYYFVQLQPTGWVIVSADDILKPVIGFSFDNQLQPFDQWEWSAKVWFSKIDKHIGLALENPDLEKNEGWASLYSSGYLKSTTIQAVEPIITVNWDQGSGWNRFAPKDTKGPGGNAYIGCVAVCMAQAMSVYAYPEYPMGEHGYTHDDYGYLYVNYDNQPAYNWSKMSATYSDDENARLLYHLAVAVDMDFGADGSGAYTRKTPAVMKNHYGYSESAKYEYRVNFPDAQWKQKVIDELVQGRPLIYAGDGNNNEPGHAFNVDGVASDGNYFHLNWGWSGSGNGYYTLDALTPNGHNFSYDQAAVFGIKPVSAGPYNITLPVQSVYDKQPEGTFVSKVEVADEDSNNTYTYVLKGRFNVLLDDYGPANFYIENDSLKTSKVFDYDSYTSEPLILEVSDPAGNFFKKEFQIAINKFYFGPTAVSLSDSLVEEGKSSGYYVGTLVIEDDITANSYTFSCKGGYDPGSLTDKTSFKVRNDSLFTNRAFYKSDGLAYFLELSIADNKGHLLKEIFEITVVDNISGASSSEDHLWTDLVIFPNPAAEFVTVETGDAVQVLSTIEIYTISGQRLVNQTIERGNLLDVSMLQDGIYLAVIQNGDKRAQRKLVIAR